jgi:hypothetical protein
MIRNDLTLSDLFAIFDSTRAFGTCLEALAKTPNMVYCGRSKTKILDPGSINSSLNLSP